MKPTIGTWWKKRGMEIGRAWRLDEIYPAGNHGRQPWTANNGDYVAERWFMSGYDIQPDGCISTYRGPEPLIFDPTHLPCGGVQLPGWGSDGDILDLMPTPEKASVTPEKLDQLELFA